MTFLDSDNIQSTNYKKIAILVDQYLDLHKGETFDLDTICRQLQINERENRNYLTIILSKLVHKTPFPPLDKNNRLYRIRDNNYKSINWVDADATKSFPINWPYGIEDNSRFGFDGHVVISPGDVIVIAGNSNMGKTSLCLNILWENMDNIPCTLMGNEYTPIKFKRRVSHMKWKEPTNGSGLPKFELIERRDNWKDIIRPDNLNIIDWVNMDDNFYRIGSIIEGLQSMLNKGVVVVTLQKNPDKTLGMGGGFSEHLASLYLSIDYQRMTVVKAKEWFDHNPNNEMYGFEIVNYGTIFNNIRKIKKCPRCYGTGKLKGSQCETCQGTCYIDA